MTNSEPAAEEFPQGIDLIALWRLLWRYKIFIVSFTMACGILAVVYALTAKPVYRAELVLTEVHPGIAVDQVRDATAWPLRVADDLHVTEPPTDEQLTALRELLSR